MYCDTAPPPCIQIDISDRRLALFTEDDIKSFPVATGKPSHPTAVGRYHAQRKVVDPIFVNPFNSSSTPPGKGNPLGSRAIVLGDIAIHGTNNPNSIGRYASHGCIRMHNADIEYIFDKVDIGTTIYVVE